MLVEMVFLVLDLYRLNGIIIEAATGEYCAKGRPPHDLREGESSSLSCGITNVADV